MADNSHYWKGKDLRATEAQSHHLAMMRDYPEEIARSVKYSKIYSDTDIKAGSPPNIGVSKMEVINSDTVSAAFEHAKGRTAILNFASYKDPGGMFLQGSKAQEECLCHESTLYEVLSQIPEFYEWNRKNLNRGLYLNRAIASPDVIFARPDKVSRFDVITCAAPNASVYCKYNQDSGQVKQALESRIKFIKGIVENGSSGKIETLILGAYGCGVFGLDPKMVAEAFKSTFYISSVKNIYFAIIEGGKSNNFEVFKQVIG